MARKTATIVIDAEGRDKGKQFLVTEMSAVDGERIALRIFQMLCASGVDLDLNTASARDVAHMVFSAMSQLQPEQIEEIGDKLMECVQYLSPDGKTTRRLVAGELEEISSRLLLKKEAFMLSFGNFFNGFSQLLRM